MSNLISTEIINISAHTFFLLKNQEDQLAVESEINFEIKKIGIVLL